MAFSFLYANPFGLATMEKKDEFYTYIFSLLDRFGVNISQKFENYQLLLGGDFNLSAIFENEADYLATIQDGQQKMKFVDNSLETTGDLLKNFDWEMIVNNRNDAGNNLDV